MAERFCLPAVKNCPVASCSRISAVHRAGDSKVGFNDRLCGEYCLALGDESLAESELRVWQLTEPMRSNQIADAFGGGAEIEITLSQVWQIMIANSRGLLPIDLADGQMNLSLVPNSAGELRLIYYTRWRSQLPEWFAYRNWDLGSLDANSTETRPWPAGTRVIGKPSPIKPANNP
jgi:hypothetical protein